MQSLDDLAPEVALITAMKMPSFLIALQGLLRSVEIERDVRPRLDRSVEEETDEQRLTAAASWAVLW